MENGTKFDSYRDAISVRVFCYDDDADGIYEECGYYSSRSVQILISNNPGNLQIALEKETITIAATVEAEYGETCVRGFSVRTFPCGETAKWYSPSYTMAHHGLRRENPAPCVTPYMGRIPNAIGISHCDLDTIGGIMGYLGIERSFFRNGKEEFLPFWKLAAFVDVNGVHKLHEANAAPETVRQLNAWYAYQANTKVFAPRDGSVANVSRQIHEAIVAVQKILSGDEEMLAAGDEFLRAKESLDRDSFMWKKDGVILRVYGGFTNHLYRDGIAVVALNTSHHSITVSFADGGDDVLNAEKIVQHLFPDQKTQKNPITGEDEKVFLAGGHRGIAGSPRENEYGEADAFLAFDYVTALVRSIK
jgi:hypothetical protein